MKLFDVYPLFDIEPVRAEGASLWDKDGQHYLDLYGGHAVISIGHSHPHYVEKLSDQLKQIGFYSNSIINRLQQTYADRLEELSGCSHYQLFFCNSGAEANENALKVASFHTGRSKVIAMKRAFHGRTSGVVAATDNPKIVAPFNAGHDVQFVDMNDDKALESAIDDHTAAVIIEGSQGVAGIFDPSKEYLEKARKLCNDNGALLILDEVQSGFGRTGEFFAFQHSAVRPDIISMAKGMGNGFPVGGLLIDENIQPWHGMLGTTFGGNHLACAAALAVLDVIESEDLVNRSKTMGDWIYRELQGVDGIKEVRGRGLMLAIELDQMAAPIRKKLLDEYKLFTGSSANAQTIRLLPPLNIKKEDLLIFINALKEVLS